jgi:hypothetical protein
LYVAERQDASLRYNHEVFCIATQSSCGLG